MHENDRGLDQCKLHHRANVPDGHHGHDRDRVKFPCIASRVHVHENDHARHHGRANGPNHVDANDQMPCRDIRSQ